MKRLYGIGIREMRFNIYRMSDDRRVGSVVDTSEISAVVLWCAMHDEDTDDFYALPDGLA